MDKVLDYMEENKQDIIKDIRYLVERDSPSNDVDLVDLCADRIQKLFVRYFGYSADVIKNSDYGDHLRFEYGEGERTILILSHFDTVWDEGDLKLKIDGDKLYGPGILDMKGGLVQAIWSIKAIKDLSLEMHKKIVFLCTSDEEIGSPSSKSLIESEANNSDYVLVTEPPVAETGALKTGRKGSSRYFVEVKGKKAHSGNNHEDGINAIKEAARQIVYLESLTDYKIGTTINVGSIKGGGKLNVVPDFAKFGVNVRVSTKKEQKRIDQLIKNLSPYEYGIKLKVSGGINRPPMNKSEATEELFEIAQDVAADLDLGELEQAYVGGGSDGNFTASLGIPTLDGLGAVGEGIHAKNEHILASEIPNRSALLCRLLTVL
ncbi:MAG TPA: M20 family metallopeptidase [Sporosarcina psychrophila]|uniref:M20 family metallopeptidase n=1 Tax=Sporosarcina psychrophila TaxID=1476 RepID=A0A921FV58_SPOPS|nr:M20 family metallopeptidase [Sporosarcina psychrophila]